MTRQKSFKDKVRTRQAKTGESYSTARRQLIEKSETEARKRRTPKTISGVRKSEKSVHDKTGRTWDEWFKLLDKWGAKQKKHGEIARWLVEEHQVDGWWAQSITGAYEQDRGIRAPGQIPLCNLHCTFGIIHYCLRRPPRASILTNGLLRKDWGKSGSTNRGNMTRGGEPKTVAEAEGGSERKRSKHVDFQLSK